MQETRVEKLMWALQNIEDAMSHSPHPNGGPKSPSRQMVADTAFSFAQSDARFLAS